MAANVTIHHSAFSDRRIAYLGELAGYSTMEALGRLAALWSRCTELQTDRPGAFEIRSCLGPRGDQLLVECGLGEAIGDEVRVRGCQGRTEWFGEVGPGAPRQTAGGKARASKAQRDARGRLLPTSKAPPASGDAGPMLDVAGPATVQHPSNRPASDPDLDPEIRDTRSARAIPPTTDYDPSSIQHVNAWVDWTYRAVSESLVAVAAELGIPDALPFPMRQNTPVESRGARDLRDRIREEGAIAPQVCKRVVEALAAEARETKGIDWLSEKAFTPGGWRHARDAASGRRQRRAPRRATEAIGAASPRTDHPEGDRLIPFSEL